MPKRVFNECVGTDWKTDMHKLLTYLQNPIEYYITHVCCLKKHGQYLNTIFSRNTLWDIITSFIRVVINGGHGAPNEKDPMYWEPHFPIQWGGNFWLVQFLTLCVQWGGVSSCLKIRFMPLQFGEPRLKVFCQQFEVCIGNSTSCNKKMSL